MLPCVPIFSPSFLVHDFVFLLLTPPLTPKNKWLARPIANMWKTRDTVRTESWFTPVRFLQRSPTRCKIWFTLGLFANYFSLELLSLSLKVTWMCYKVNWNVERQVYCLIWIINLLMGASLLALAKSIYYEFPKGRTIRKVKGGDFRAAGIFFRYQIPCMNFF